MMSRLAAALILLLVAGCKPAPPQPGAGHVTLAFTAQNHGRLTPCGCFRGQFGGISRLKTALAAEHPDGVVALDIGDALEGPEDYQLLKYKQVVKADAMMGYVALNVGQREAGLSADTLRKLAAGSPVPLLSANVLDRATGKPLLPGSIIVNHDGMRIAIVGVVDPKGLGDSIGEGLAVEEMATCLGRILPGLRGAADLYVLMAFTDEAGLSELARDFYEFHVILGGKVSQPAQSLGRENQSLIYYTANESKSYGSLDLTLEPGGRVTPGEHHITLLHDGFPQDPDVLNLTAEYRKETRAAHLAMDDPAHVWENQVRDTHAGAEFAGSESCVGCHASAAASWARTGHAHAFDALAAKDADADPSCIGCHTVGFGSAGGYRRAYGRARLTDVGCESCHGPGSLHVAQRQAGGPVTFFFRPLAAGDCAKCHDGEFSPPFDYAKSWPQIQHGKEPRS